MKKARLAVCMEDPIYQERFVKCLMHHYMDKYEMHTFSNMADLRKKQAGEFDLFIFEGEGMEEDAKQLADEKEKVLFLCEQQEKRKSDFDLIYEEMFQEVYKIMESVEQLLGTKGLVTADTIKRIGVFSLECPTMQLPYCAMLGSIYGETRKALVINLLPHSGITEPREENLCFEDVIAAVSTGNLTSNCLLSGIGHMPKWDFLYPVKNTEHLAEIEVKAYEEMLERFIKEQGYEVVIISFGAPFLGMFEFMESCKEFYLLQRKGSFEQWREKDFQQELERREKEELLDRITKIEIPILFTTEDSWLGLSEKWEWGVLGDYVRKRIRMENTSG